MEREFAKFIYFICLLSITLFLLLEVIQFTSNQTQKTYNLKFTPPLKGTEILLEAEQKGGLKRGIWALDLGTEKARFLIPNGSRPVWSPQRNYFAYQDYLHPSFINVVDKAGKVIDKLEIHAANIQLTGWRDEKWLLITAICSFPKKDYFSAYYQTICFNYSPLDISEIFPGHHAGNPSISPDGKHIAFEVFKFAPGVGKLNSKIAVADLEEKIEYVDIEEEEKIWYKVPCLSLEAQNIRRLTALPLNILEINPKWSPDGNKIAFEVVDPRSGNCIAHVVNSDGTGLKGLEFKGGKGEERPHLEEGLIMEGFKDHSLQVLGWVSSNHIAVIDSRYPFVDHIWIVDLNLGRPSACLLPSNQGEGIKFILLSKKQLAWLETLGDGNLLFKVSLFDLVLPQKQEKMRWILDSDGRWIFPKEDLIVYWASW
jgi:hypothetical protein